MQELRQHEHVRKMAFPRWGDYHLAFRYLLVNGCGVDYVIQPEITKRTVELGAKNSPEYVCAPFKTVLGSAIEALEAGADTLWMFHGDCRLGYFGELMQQILSDLGYEFDFLNLAEYDMSKKKDWLRILKYINPKVHYTKVAMAALDAIKMIECIDEVTAEYYQNCGFETEPGAYRKAYRAFLTEMEHADSRQKIENDYRKCLETFREIPLNKPPTPLRVGVIGEYYTVMDAPSNLHTEQKLADMGVEVHRWMNLTNRQFRYPGEKNMNIAIRDLDTFEMGPTSTATLWCARNYAQRGFDGLVHVKGANCTPEIDVMPLLQRISVQEKIPILYLSFDSQTSDVGLMTRLEAFYDMIAMRKKAV